MICRLIKATVRAMSERLLIPSRRVCTCRGQHEIEDLPPKRVYWSKKGDVLYYATEQ